MCGIVGFTGVQQAAPILLDGLSKLEYRGYDSAGIAVRNGENETEVVKAKGRLKALAEKTDNGETVIGSCGIGHTRWATHGEPSESNAHPHKSDDGNVVAVHYGIIENYLELKEKLKSAKTENEKNEILEEIDNCKSCIREMESLLDEATMEKYTKEVLLTTEKEKLYGKETEELMTICERNGRIPPELFKEFGVKRGLRDVDGTGVLAGISNISRIDAF